MVEIIQGNKDFLCEENDKDLRKGPKWVIY